MSRWTGPLTFPFHKTGESRDRKKRCVNSFVACSLLEDQYVRSSFSAPFVFKCTLRNCQRRGESLSTLMGLGFFKEPWPPDICFSLRKDKQQKNRVAAQWPSLGDTPTVLSAAAVPHATVWQSLPEQPHPVISDRRPIKVQQPQVFETFEEPHPLIGHRGPREAERSQSRKTFNVPETRVSHRGVTEVEVFQLCESFEMLQTRVGHL